MVSSTRELELRVVHLVTHRMELLQTALKILNPDPCVAPTDGQHTFVAACDGEIGSKGMGFGV